MNRIFLRRSIGPDDTGRAVDLLALHSGLSKMQIKDAMAKGALWLHKKGKKTRLRRATTLLQSGDAVELFYDAELLSRVPPQASLIDDRWHYSVWHKPAGLLTQGTKYGDHCSLLRQAERFFTPPRRALPVHRLDREASGLVLIAHTGKAAAGLSELMRKRQVTKVYRIEVLGNLAEKAATGIIDFPLDGKTALTEYEVLHYNPAAGISIVEAVIKTGRLHQIRRHFNMLGFPVMGDPRYGRRNKNAEGIQLEAVALRFHCPFKKREVAFQIATDTHIGDTRRLLGGESSSLLLPLQLYSKAPMSGRKDCGTVTPLISSDKSISTPLSIQGEDIESE